MKLPIKEGAKAWIRGLPEGHHLKPTLEGVLVRVVNLGDREASVYLVHDHTKLVLISLEYLHAVERKSSKKIEKICDDIKSRAAARLNVDSSDVFISVFYCKHWGENFAEEKTWKAMLKNRFVTRYFGFGKTPQGALIRLLKSISTPESADKKTKRRSVTIGQIINAYTLLYEPGECYRITVLLSKTKAGPCICSCYRSSYADGSIQAEGFTIAQAKRNCLDKINAALAAGKTVVSK